MTPPTVLVIVPTYNERDNLPVLVAGLMAQPNTRIMVIDDQSPDGTGAVADALALAHPGRIDVMHRTGRRGLGRSYIDGMRRAVAEDVEFICQMDADLSHDPRHLPALVSACVDADLVIGSRYIPGGRIVNWPFRRLLLSRFANLYIRSVTRLVPRDCTSGYRCWRRGALAALSFDRIASDGYALMVEMLYLAARRGYRITEAPITFVERQLGASKLSRAVIFESVVVPWRLIATRGRTR
jgi:dolichol-phosphate mannosyltransferase